MISMASAGIRAFGPVRMAFLCSLLLSTVAVWNAPALNRDGILYVELAQAIMQQGFGSLFQENREWLFLIALPVCIAITGLLTGLGAETAAHLVNAFLMAGTCAILIAVIRRRDPSSAWVGVLVVLAMPACNDYRDQVLREYGFWFFSLLAIWLAMKWDDSGRWREALFCQMAVLCAALFRLEAVAIFPALMLWQAVSTPAGSKLRRIFMIGSLPLIAVGGAALVFASGLVAVPARIAYFFDAANPLRKLQIINEAAGRMSEFVFKHKYSREEAGYVLFFGLLTIIPVKFIKMSGLFILPFIYAFKMRPIRVFIGNWQPLAWVFLAHVLVLAAFVTHQFFLVGRYVAFLNLLSIPIAAAGMAALLRRYPRWRLVILGLAILTLLAKVAFVSPKSTQIVEAGKWLSQNVTDPSRVYVDNPRVAFYGGLGYLRAGRTLQDIPTYVVAAGEKRFEMLVVDVPRRDNKIESWLESNQFRIVQKFTNRVGDAVVVAVPVSSQGSPATTERSRSNTAPIE